MSTVGAKAAGAAPFENFLNRLSAESWSAAINSLLPSIHEVDRAATQIWFAFYPLDLFCALSEAEDAQRLARELLLQGDFYLRDQIDTSHKFLYGHRHWREVKEAVEEHAELWPGREAAKSTAAGDSEVLAAQVRRVARNAVQLLRVDESLLLGITAVAFMTIRQAGLAPFKAASGAVTIDQKRLKKSAQQILKERAKDDSQGLLGFLKTVDKKWTVTFDENDDTARYRLRHMQDLAWGAADDQSRDWRALDPRRIEGPIPVECRSASCGTCWVGILGGAEKLAAVAAREGKKIKEFGYIDTDEPKPLIRLACQAQAQGAVSLVIPPWNGVFGKFLKSRNEPVNEEVSPEVN